MDRDPVVISGLAHTFGWVRRRDLEKGDGTEVWEGPDGQLWASPNGEPVIEKLIRSPGLTRPP